jgi:hypothetical protein
MEIMDKHKILARLCRETKKYGMFISFSEEEAYSTVVKDAPYLSVGCDQVLNDGEGWLLFDNEDEMHEYYDETIGDDGPVCGIDEVCEPGMIYALTCNPNGQFETENT